MTKRALDDIDEDMKKVTYAIHDLERDRKRLKKEYDTHPKVVATRVPSFLRYEFANPGRIHECTVTIGDKFDDNTSLWIGKMFSCRAKVDGIGGTFEATFSDGAWSVNGDYMDQAADYFWIPSRDVFRGLMKLSVLVKGPAQTLWEMCLSHNRHNALYAIVSLLFILATRCGEVGDDCPQGWIMDIHDDSMLARLDMIARLDTSYRDLCDIYGLACELSKP